MWEPFASMLTSAVHVPRLSWATGTPAVAPACVKLFGCNRKVIQCHSHNQNTREIEIKGSLPLLGTVVPRPSCPPPLAWRGAPGGGCRGTVFNSQVTFLKSVSCLRMGSRFVSRVYHCSPLSPIPVH